MMGLDRRAGIGWALAAVLAALFAPRTAQADRPEVAVEIGTVLGTTALASGWNEVVVRVRNDAPSPARGKVELHASGYLDRDAFRATAPYHVAPGGAAIIRVPAYVSQFVQVGVRTISENGVELAGQEFSPTTQPGVVLFDIEEDSHLRGALNDVVVVPSYTPSAGAPGTFHPAAGTSTLAVDAPRFDPATGDPILPDRAALYAPAAAVLVKTDRFVRITGTELEALSGYVLGGGTLALVVSRPEDLRSPNVAALLGGEARPTTVSPDTMKHVSPPTPRGSSVKSLADAPVPSDAVAKLLSGYDGGNLHPTVYGASAYYGLGEVHLLAFDPTRKPVVDDPWALVRVADLTRRASDRRASVVLPPGREDVGDLTPARKHLDPTENARWAIGAAALLLCLYAVIAGPVNFSMATRSGRPLRALRLLPAIAAFAFLIVLGIGIAARGVRARSRRLALVEAGAGMTDGCVRRLRAFFTPGDRALSIGATDAASVVRSAVPSDSKQTRDHLVVERGGVRLTDIPVLPWQTIVVREDGLASLGDGISIVSESNGELAVVNRTGHPLRAAVLVAPNIEPLYFPRIRDGERALASAGTRIASMPSGDTWVTHLGGTTAVGSMVIHALNASDLDPVLHAEGAQLADAWEAIEKAASDQVDWFPVGVPVLLAQIDGGEGRARDSGIPVESERVLLRVVGYGGRP